MKSLLWFVRCLLVLVLLVIGGTVLADGIPRGGPVDARRAIGGAALVLASVAAAMRIRPPDVRLPQPRGRPGPQA